MPLDGRGTVVLKVQDDNVLRILNNDLHGRLIAIEQERDALKSQLADVIAAAERDSPQVGF